MVPTHSLNDSQLSALCHHYSSATQMCHPQPGESEALGKMSIWVVILFHPSTPTDCEPHIYFSGAQLSGL